MPENKQDSTKTEFINYLKSKGLSPKSHKNYKSDLSHFISWAILKVRSIGAYVETLAELVPFLNGALSLEYRSYMIENSTPVKTINRRLSTLRNLSRFLVESNTLDFDFTEGLKNISSELKKEVSDSPIADNFKSYLESEKVSPNTIKNYVSDIKHFISSQPSLSKVTSGLIENYKDNLSVSFSPATVKRKTISLKKFLDWARSQGITDANFEAKKTLTAKTAGNNRLKNWYKRYQRVPGARYLNIGVIVVLASLLGLGIYNQFLKNASRPLAFTTSLTAPNRYLSFQGRLTNQYGNPITTATNVVFNLYSASSGGSPLWGSSTCSISPDTDGVFSTLLGSSCGSAISSDVFSQNAAVWVGVTVGTDAEATPRVQIATVAYALNSETLQGYPASASATSNTVPVVNNSGQIVLAVSSPKILSSSGNFAIEGQALTIDTPSSSNGSITISPDGTGSANLTFVGASAGNGKGMVNATDANLTSTSLYYGSVASNASGYNLLQLQSGSTLSDKFVVDSSGNASASGNLTLAGAAARSIQTTADANLTLGGSTTGNIVLAPSNNVAGGYVAPNTTNVTDLGTSSLLYRNIYGTSLYQGTYQVCDSSGANCPSGSNLWGQSLGSLYPTNNTVNVYFGASSATATTSAKFAFTGINGGTPTASIAGTTAGVATFLDGNGNISSTNRNNLTLGNSSTYNTTGNVLLNPNETGYVGIGTTTPKAVLDVSENSTSSAYLYQASNDTSAFTLSFRKSEGTITSPTNASYNDTFGSIKFQDYAGGWFDMAKIDAGADAANSAGRLSFYTSLNNSGVVTERMRISNVGNVGIGNTNPLATLHVTGTYGGNAAAIIDQPLSGNILTASASGVTKLTLDTTGNLTTAGNASASGNLTLAGAVARTIQTTGQAGLTIGGATTGNITISASNDLAAGSVAPNVTNVTDLGLSTKLWRNVYATALYQGTYQVCDSSGANCPGGASYWGLGSGALFTNNNTVDVLLGANSSSSAKFAFTGVSKGTPTASIAGTTTGVATFIDGNGNISSTNRNNLTLGNSATYNTTGNILLNPNGTGNVGIGTTTASALLDVSGNASVSGTLAFHSGTGTIQTTAFSPLVLGGSTTGNITLNPSNAVAGGNVVPNTTNVTDLGTASLLWRNVYGTTVTGTSVYQGANQVCDTSGNCAGATDLWAVANGTTYPRNNTLDLLIGATAGATATSSAKFAFTGVSKGTPTASIAGTTAGVATYITGNGNLATTNMQPLTIGGLTTGSVQINPQNSTGLFVNGSGQVGINTTSFLTSASNGERFEVRGDSTYSGAGGGQLTITGAANQNQFLTIGYNTTSNQGFIQSAVNFGATQPFFINPDGANVGINTKTTTAALDVAGTASVSGTLAFHAGTANIQTTNQGDLTIGGASSGNIMLAPFANGGTGGYMAPVATGHTDLGTSTLLFRNIYGTTLYQGTNQVCDTSGNCAAGTDIWSIANGALYPKSNSVDLLLGATSTASAKFAFTGVLKGTPTASISGTTASVATYLTGNGNLATTNMAALTLGGSSTGNVQISANNNLGVYVDASGHVGISHAPNAFSNLEVDGYGTVFNLTNLSGSTDNKVWGTALSATTLSMQVTSDSYGSSQSWLTVTRTGTTTSSIAFPSAAANVGIGTSTPTALLDVSGNASVSGTLAFHTGTGTIQSTTMSPLVIGGSSTGNITLNPSNAVAGGNVSPSTTGVTDLGTSSLLYRNIYGTAIYQGTYQVCDSSGANCPSGSSYWGLGSGALFTANNTVDVLIGANSTASAKFAFTGVKTGTPTASISGTTTGVATFINGNGYLSSTNGNNLTLGNSSTYSTTGNVLINPNGTGNVGIGNSSPTAKLDLADTSVSTGNVINASASAITTGNLLRLATGGTTTFSGNAISVDLSNGGGAGAFTGNFIKFANAGVTKFLVDSLGNATIRGVTYSWPAADAGASGYVLSSNGSGTLSWVAQSGGSNYWALGAGTIYPGNTTQDLLIGSNATKSADFAFTGVDVGTPTASIAGTTAGIAAFLTGNGNLATTNMGNLVLGGASTGNIQFAAGSATPAMVLTTAGTVGIGTTSPLSRLSVIDSSANSTGHAAFSIDQQEAQDILTASASGTTKMTLANDGTLNLYNATSSIANTTGSITITPATNLLISQGNVGVDTATPGAALQVGVGTSTHSLGVGSEYIANNLELDSTLYLDGGQIANSFGTVAMTLSAAPTTTPNYLSASNWELDNTANVGQAALMVNQLKGGDIFTASASGVPKFVISNSGNVGIGTTSPSTKLAVIGSTSGISNATTDWAYTSTGSVLQMATGASTGNTYQSIMALTNGGSAWGNLVLQSGGGNVGIGTTNPNANLTVVGNIDIGYNPNVSGGLYLTQTSQYGVPAIQGVTSTFGGNQNIAINPVGGNVGIGTTNPNQGKLQIVGSGPQIFVANSDFVSGSAGSGYYIGTGASSGNTYTGIVSFTTGNTAYGNVVFPGGNVGIGTTNPGGTLNINSTYTGTSRTANLFITSANNINQKLYLGINSNGGATTGDYASLEYLQEGQHWGALALQADGGNVGIGTASPNATLEVNGNVAMTGGINAFGDEESMVPNAGFEINNGTTPDGWVTIGSGINAEAITTTSPAQGNYSATLQANAGAGNAAWWENTLCFPITGGNTYNLCDTVKSNVTTTSGHTVDLKTYTTLANCKSSTSGTDNILTSATSTSYTTKQGTVTPAAGQNWANFYVENYQPNVTSTLTVDSIRVVPTALTQGVDFAENYPVLSSDTPQAGDLVTLGPLSNQNTAYVVKTTQANDQNIIGVISTNPAETLDDGGDYLKEPVALSGRVPVKVSSQNGPIMIGDKLTSSSIPGVAMKATKAGNVVGEALESYNDPDPQNIGSVTVFINPSWYDPDVFLTSTGDMNIQAVANTTGSANTYQLTNAGTVIDRIGAFANVVAADVKAGAIATSDFVTQNLNAAVATVQQLTANSLAVKLISPVPGDTNVTVQIGTASESGQFAVQNANGNNVATIDSTGNATFSGQLTSNNLQVTNEATVSGTLYADNIQSKSLDDIQALLTQVQSDQNLLKDAANWNVLTATNSASLNDLAVSDLYITNQAAINSLSVTNSLAVGSDLIVQSDLTTNSQLLATSINTLSAPLKIQSLAMAPVEIMDGLVTIDTKGNVNIAGDLFVAGQIHSSGLTLKDNQQSVINNPQSASSSASLLTLQDVNGNVVSSVDASGSAQFNGISTQRLTIAGATDATVSGVVLNGIITTNSTIGQAVIPAGVSEITIKNPKITDYTLVYVTPTSSTNNYVLYVKSKQDGQFTVGFSNPIDVDANFNWWVVQVSQ